MTQPQNNEQPKLLTERELRERIDGWFGEYVEEKLPTWTPAVKSLIVDFIQSQKLAHGEMIKDELLFDLDEIDNKPWRVFRQLGKLLPTYKDEYERYERFYEHGGGNEVLKLIEAFEQREVNKP